MNRLKTLSKNPTTLYCFSPEVMLATFIIEVSLAIFVRIKHGTSPLSRLIIFTLICLAVFQGIEYHICEINDQLTWAKLGLVAITLLPPLGIHIAAMISGIKRFVLISYLLGLAYIVAYLFVPGLVTGATCGGNYVIVHTQPNTGYVVYYTALLFLGIFEAWRGMRQPHVSRAQKDALRWLIIGYASFMSPLILVYLMTPHALEGTSSIMCGFAVLLALILTFRVLPLAHQTKSDQPKTKK